MARIASKRIFASPSPSADVTGYEWFIEAATRPNFLPDVDAGTLTPFASTATPELILDKDSGLAEGQYQIALVAMDAAGNRSDPYQAEVWVDVPFDLTAPEAPHGGGIENL